MDYCRSFPGKSWLARGHLIENRAKRKYIRANVQILATRLLRRHISYCPHGRAGCGYQLDVESAGCFRLTSIERALSRGLLGDAKVHHFSAMLRHKNVGGFDVTVDDAFLMCCVQRIGN